ncbi:hypothetical protein CVT26_000885 [Gymnopilus dilepis]|uniref:Beta/gamma crystallin 'Greek key' domain-containing protein n=1 Tax=Gymnopilus dilepis TaxID=231916 RepID=A0A409X576_9AGAR|nr:hypothetical protein CVT26_000885 [Gymnopilus dilepis]
MLFTTAKFTALLLAIAGSAQASVTPREELAPLSITFYDDVNYAGRPYSPAAVPGQCFTLPGDWLDRPQSVVIGPGYTCSFYVYADCVGSATVLSGSVPTLRASNLYNDIHSLLCTKN